MIETTCLKCNKGSTAACLFMYYRFLFDIHLNLKAPSYKGLIKQPQLNFPLPTTAIPNSLRRNTVMCCRLNSLVTRLLIQRVKDQVSK